jgi:GNAT superfamily N-acetyltransferase
VNQPTIIRCARLEDYEAIDMLIRLSSRKLAIYHYPPELVEAALQTVLGVDTRLIADGTYLVASRGGQLVGCGGWSWRRTLFGSDSVTGRDDDPLHPATDAAKIRAYFVHPGFTRQGIGSAILQRCEKEAARYGFRRLELGATLSGVAFYEAHGYLPVGRCDYECAPGLVMEIISMIKVIEPG